MRIGNTFFQENRDEFINRLPEGTAVFIFAGDTRPMSQDDDYRFLPDRNFYYLTGLDFPGGKLILTKKGEESSVKLFAPVKDDFKERWHGKISSFEELSEISGLSVDDILPEGDFEDNKYEILKGGYVLAYDGTSVADSTKAFASEKDVTLDIGEILTRMRMVKREAEIGSIREAAKITEAALEEMKSYIRIGGTEVDIFAPLEFGMVRRNSLIPAFATITAIDGNAFYLHHSIPEGEEGPKIGLGSQIQIDVGGRYNGYCADISRVYFVGGRSSDDDKRFVLLELIRKLRREAFGFIKPGVTFTTLNEHMWQITGQWLTKNGLAPEDPSVEDIRKYYWHNTSHHLGLDVHDISLRELPFEKGNCLAVEPGVYIPEWNVGFRIEDDVLVTEDGCELLSSGIDSDDSIVVVPS